MSNIVKINNYGIQVKEFNGQRVVTFKDIDLAHNRPEAQGDICSDYQGILHPVCSMRNELGYR